MGRIRSLHPGQWTDEDFVGLSFPARLLAIGLRNEADDNGVFEWKPVVLRMRLFPADTVDVPELLAELISANQVKEFSCDGRVFGAIRNFRVYQNPKSPKAQFPIPPELEEFVGIAGGESAPAKRSPGRPRKEISNTSASGVPQNEETNCGERKSFPQNVENNSLMEGREEKSNIDSSSPVSARDENRKSEPEPEAPPGKALQLAMDAAGMDRKPPDWREHFDAWAALGCDFHDDVLPTIRKVTAEIAQRGGRKPFRMKVFDDAIREKVSADAREVARWRESGERNRQADAEQVADDARQLAELDAIIADRKAAGMPFEGLEKKREQYL